MSAGPVQKFEPKPLPRPPERPAPLAPHSIDTEEFLLGALLIGHDPAGARLEQLTAADFFLTQHSWIYQAVLDLDDQGVEADVISVQALLEQRGQLQQLSKAGQTGFLVLAWFASFRASGMQVRAYAKIIREKAVRRRGLDQASELARAMFDETTEAGIQIDRHLRAIEKIRPFNPNAAFVRGADSADLHETMLHQETQRQAWHALPWLALGERAPVTMDGDLIVVVGPEGSGKSALLMNWAEYEARQGCKTVYIHTEMNKKQVFDRRLVANHRSVPFATLQKPETLTDDQWKSLVNTGIDMDSWLKHLDYWHAGLIEESKLFAVMQRLCDDFGTRLFVLDYLNDVIPERERGSNNAITWRNLLARLEAFNNRNHTRVVTAAQVNNEGNAYMVGKALRQKAALFIKIKPEALDHPFDFQFDGIPYRYLPGDFKPVMTLAVEKYRGGGRGTVQLLFVGPRYLWVDVPVGFDDGSDDPGAYTPLDLQGFSETWEVPAHWSTRTEEARG